MIGRLMVIVDNSNYDRIHVVIINSSRFMSGQNQQGFFINTESEENPAQQSTQGSFILSSPTNSAIKSQSPTLKKTKYDKLLKLYNDILDKKNRIAAKQSELQQKKKVYQSMQSCHQSQHTEGSNKLEQLKQTYDEKRRLNLAEATSSENYVKDALKEIMDLDLQIKETHAKKQQQYTAKKSAELDTISKYEQLFAQKTKQHQEINTQIHDLESQLSVNNKQKQSAPNANFLLQLDQLEKEKRSLESEINRARVQIQQINKQITQAESKLQKQKQDRGCNSGNSTTEKEQLSQLVEKQSKLEKVIQELKDKLEKDNATAAKINKNIPNLDKNIKEQNQKLKKAEKQQKQKAANLQKVKQETKERYIEVPPEYRQLKASNDKLKAEVERLNVNYQNEQAKQNTLVPPNVIQNYSEKIQIAKQYYEQNKDLPARMKKLEQQIQALIEEKDSLEWNVNPTLKNIQESQKREEERIRDLDEQIKRLQKQSAQITSKLEQYTKAYPDFEFQRKKSKKQVPPPVPTPIKKQSKEDKVEEATNKKKKKGKAADKSPEPVATPVEQIKEEKEEEKEEEKKEQKIEPQPVEEEKAKGKAKGKKNKKK